MDEFLLGLQQEEYREACTVVAIYFTPQAHVEQTTGFQSHCHGSSMASANFAIVDPVVENCLDRCVKQPRL